MTLATLALYSDRLFMAAVGVYVLAMVLHGAEYASVRAVRRRCWSARGAGAGTDDAAPPSTAPTGGRTRRRAVRADGRRRCWCSGPCCSRLASSLAGWPPGRGRWATCTSSPRRSASPPWWRGSWCCAASRRARPAGLFVLLPVVMLLFLAGTVLYARPRR